MNLVIIGMRGVGKTVVGKELAKRLSKDFYDIDQLCQERLFETIQELFKHGRESVFREMECRVISETAKKDNSVISVGGGFIQDENNVKKLKKNGKLILLELNANEVIKRLKLDRESASLRPELTNEEIEKIKQLAKTREPLYIKAADYVVDRNNKDVNETVDEIIKKVRGI